MESLTQTTLPGARKMADHYQLIDGQLNVDYSGSAALFDANDSDINPDTLRKIHTLDRFDANARFTLTIYEVFDDYEFPHGELAKQITGYIDADSSNPTSDDPVWFDASQVYAGVIEQAVCDFIETDAQTGIYEHTPLSFDDDDQPMPRNFAYIISAV